MKNIFHEHRNISPHRHAERGHAEGQYDQSLHRSLLPDEANSLLQTAEERLRGTLRQESRRDNRQRNNRSEKRKRVQPKAPLFPEPGQRYSSQRWTDRDREIELNR